MPCPESSYCPPSVLLACLVPQSTDFFPSTFLLFTNTWTLSPGKHHTPPILTLRALLTLHLSLPQLYSLFQDDHSSYRLLLTLSISMCYEHSWNFHPLLLLLFNSSYPRGLNSCLGFLMDHLFTIQMAWLLYTPSATAVNS